MKREQRRTGQMINANWLAINTALPFPIVKQLLQDRKLSQKQLTDFWKAFHQVKEYIN
jgi:hypothetical protein